MPAPEFGREAAIIFAENGAKVAVVDCNESYGTETMKIIEQAAGKATFVRANVSKAWHFQ